MTGHDLAALPREQRVVVYRNRTASRQGRVIWSVAKATRTDGKGRLLAHVEHLALIDVTAVLSARAHTLRRDGGHREVVGWLAGTISDEPIDAPARVSFDLYGNDSSGAFFTADGIAFDHAAAATFGPAGAHVTSPQGAAQ